MTDDKEKIEALFDVITRLRRDVKQLSGEVESAIGDLDRAVAAGQMIIKERDQLKTENIKLMKQRDIAINFVNSGDYTGLRK